MKIIWLIFILVITQATEQIQAQEKSKIHFSLLGGVNSSKISLKSLSYSTPLNGNINIDVGSESSFGSRVSFYAGLKAEYELTSSLSLGSGISIENTGFTESYGKNVYIRGSGIFDSISGKDVIKLTYITAPLHLIFYGSLKRSRIYLGVGGYLSYGLTGTNNVYISSSSIVNVSDSITIISFSSDKNIKGISYRGNRWDYGVSIIGGIQFRNRFFIQGGFDAGMANILKDRFVVYDGTGKNVAYNYDNKKRMFKLGIGYILNK